MKKIFNYLGFISKADVYSAAIKDANEIMRDANENCMSTFEYGNEFKKSLALLNFGHKIFKSK